MAKGMLLAALLLGGCAGTIVQPIRYGDSAGAPGIADDAAGGIRYYETAPFLLVYSDGKGGLQSQILYLPDRTRMRSIDPYAYFASNEATLVFDHGILTQGKTVVDETLVPKAIVGVLEKAATAALAGALNEAGGDAPPDRPHLFAQRLFLSRRQRLLRNRRVHRTADAQARRASQT